MNKAIVYIKNKTLIHAQFSLSLVQLYTMAIAESQYLLYIFSCKATVFVYANELIVLKLK